MYIVIGANGFLGNYIIESIMDKTKENIIATARNTSNACINDKFFNNSRINWERFDILDTKKVDDFIFKINKVENKKIIFLCAYHNPDLVEKNEKYAWNINITQLSYFLNELSDVECFFYPSSDSVYGESKNEYHFKENDDTNPVNTYGKQKALAEKIVITKGYNVVRYPFLIAPSLVKAKKHFYDKIVEDLKNGKEVSMFFDSYRSSLNFKTAADLLIDLIEKDNKNIPQVINISGDNDLSKYDIGLKIAKNLSLESELVKPISSNTNSIFEVKRASTTLLDNTLIKSILHIDKIDFEI